MKIILLTLLLYPFTFTFSQYSWESIPPEEMDKIIESYPNYNPQIKPTEEGYCLWQHYYMPSAGPIPGHLYGPFIDWKFINYHSQCKKLWLAGTVYYAKYTYLYDTIYNKDSSSYDANYTGVLMEKVPYGKNLDLYSYKRVYYHNAMLKFPCTSVSITVNGQQQPKMFIKKESTDDTKNTGYPYFNNKKLLGSLNEEGYFEIEIPTNKELHLMIGYMYFNLRKIPFEEYEKKENLN